MDHIEGECVGMDTHDAVEMPTVDVDTGAEKWFKTRTLHLSKSIIFDTKNHFSSYII
jgi:hypothetical protein